MADFNQEQMNAIAVSQNKIFPLSFFVTEVENYLTEFHPGDYLKIVNRHSEGVEDFFGRGLRLILASSNEQRTFALYYNTKYSQFGLFNEDLQQLIYVWEVYPEEAKIENWKDTRQLVIEEEENN